MSTATELVCVGDVVVHHGEPPGANPYRRHGRTSAEPVTVVSGTERRDALRCLRDGFTTPHYTFWFAPPAGGARRLGGRDEVRWPGPV